MATETRARPVDDSTTTLARAWAGITQLMVVAVFGQSIFAGFMLSGEGWGRTLHWYTAIALVVGTLLASLIAAVTLRGVANGSRLAAMLFGLTVALAVQFTLGWRSAQGDNLLWLHVPAGVLMVGFALTPPQIARRLG